MGWTIRGFYPCRGRTFFCSPKLFRPTPGPNQPPTQRVLEAVSSGVRRSWREANHSIPFSAEIKNEWNYTSTPSILCLHDVHRGIFTCAVLLHRIIDAITQMVAVVFLPFLSFCFPPPPALSFLFNGR